MKYLLIYTKSAYKDIQKLDIITKKRIKIKLEKFIQNPLYHAKKLTHRKLGEYRFRVGNYRIVFDLDKDKIVILRIGHRKEIYKWN